MIHLCVSWIILINLWTYISYSYILSVRWRRHLVSDVNTSCIYLLRCFSRCLSTSLFFSRQYVSCIRTQLGRILFVWLQTLVCSVRAVLRPCSIDIHEIFFSCWTYLNEISYIYIRYHLGILRFTQIPCDILLYYEISHFRSCSYIF